MRIFALLSVVLSFTASNLYAEGDIAEGQIKSATCAACHGSDGNTTTDPINPKLAGQNAKYLLAQLKAFKSGERKNAIMAGMVAGLSDQDMINISAYYSSLEVQYSAVPEEYIALGQSLYRSGDKANQIPACSACHGPSGTGLPAAGFASLGGQNPEYTIAQLKAFRNGERANDPNSMMRDVAAKLTDQQIEALAYYLVGLH